MNKNDKEIYNDCIDCRWREKCRHYSQIGGVNQECCYKAPEQKIVPHWFISMKENNIPTKNNKLLNSHIKNKYLYYDLVPANYEYYVNFINDTLAQLSLGQAAIVFYDYQIKELLRFEPELHMCEYESMFYVWLPKLEKKFTIKQATCYNVKL